MGLTKPRAAQIFNLDYKQSTRVVTATPINLSGGAPSVVDSVNLVKGDRILVTGQTTGSQNGLYLVATLGSGSNGTWARTSDGNENGEIEAGMIVMVTEGIIYQDTQWKLITDNPITIGSTVLTFTQNYMANSISSGTSNVVVNSNANVTISSAGTANVLTISSTGIVTNGSASVTGNVTAGNVVTTGQANVGTLTVNGGSTFTGNLLPSANVTYNLGSPTQRWNEIFLAANTIDIGGATISADLETGSLILKGPDGAEFLLTGTSTIDAVGHFGMIEISNTMSSHNTTSGALTVAGGAGFGGNVNVGGIFKATGNVEGGNLVTSSGNIIGNYLLANIAFATGYTASKIYNGTSEANIGTSGGNANISIGGVSNVVVFSTTGQFITGLLSVTGNITSGNIAATDHTGTNVSVTGTVTATSTVGGVITGSSSSLTGTVTAASTVGGVITGTSVSVTGSATAASTVGGVITGTSTSVTGTQTAASTVGGVITGSSASVTGTVTGTSVVGGSITIASNNITGSGSTLTIDPNGAGGVDGAVVIAGNLSVQGNVTYIDSNVITTNEKSITLANNVNTGSQADGAGIDVGNNTLAYWRFNNATTSWQSNISLTPASNATLNLGATSNYWATIYATEVGASGNITSGNLLTSGVASATGNVTGGNIFTGGQISATGNITGSNIIGNTNAFKTIAVTGSSNLVAATNNQTVIFTATVASGISISADVPNSTITFDTSGSGTSIFATGGDMGTVTEAITSSEDLGLVTEAVTVNYDLGSVIDATGLVYPSQLVLPTYTSGTLPGTNPAGQFIYLSTSSVGAMTAFSDGTNWRFTSSGNIVS